MKLSLFSVLLLAFSSIQTTASVPTVHVEDRFKKRNNIDINGVAIRTTSDVDAVQIGPWGAALGFIATVAANAIGSLVANWIQKQIDDSNHEVHEYYVIQDTNGQVSRCRLFLPAMTLITTTFQWYYQSFFQMMTYVGDTLGNQFPDYGVLVIEAGAINEASFSYASGVFWVPQQLLVADGSTLK
jgi:hypothetical protein